MNKEHALKVEKLTKIYSKKSSGEILALNNLAFCFNKLGNSKKSIKYIYWGFLSFLKAYNVIYPF